MVIRALLGLLAVGPLTVWAIALFLSERRRTQPALAVYLGSTALTWVALMVGLPAGWFASQAQYTAFYVLSEIVAWGLLAATFVELASLRLSASPSLQVGAGRLVRWFWIICGLGVVGSAFAPESLLRSTSDFHAAERTLIQLTLPVGWVIFYLAGRYFNLQPTGGNAAEGWLLAGLYFGCAVLQLSDSFYAWVGICVLSSTCYGYGALLHFRIQVTSPPSASKPRITPEAAEVALLQTRARLEALDRRLDSIGKG